MKYQAIIFDLFGTLTYHTSQQAYRDVVLTMVEDEFGVGKPDKRVFLHSLEKLGAEPKDAWMVGDSPINDVDGAQRSE